MPLRIDRYMSGSRIWIWTETVAAHAAEMCVTQIAGQDSETATETGRQTDAETGPLLSHTGSVLTNASWKMSVDVHQWTEWRRNSWAAAATATVKSILTHRALFVWQKSIMSSDESFERQEMSSEGLIRYVCKGNNLSHEKSKHNMGMLAKERKMGLVHLRAKSLMKN